MRVRNVPSVLKLPRTEPSYRGGARPLPSSGRQPLPVWLDSRRILRTARSRIIPPQGPKIRKFVVSLSESFRRAARWWRIRPARNQREGASRGGGKKIQTQTIYGRRKNHLFDGRREQDLHQPETGVEQHLPLFFLRREDRHHRSERIG